MCAKQLAREMALKNRKSSMSPWLSHVVLSSSRPNASAAVSPVAMPLVMPAS